MQFEPKHLHSFWSYAKIRCFLLKLEFFQQKTSIFSKKAKLDKLHLNPQNVIDVKKKQSGELRYTFD
jgi:hypothetical protein